MILRCVRASLLCSALSLLCFSDLAYAQTSVGNCLFQNGGKNIIIMPGSTSLIPVMQGLGAKLAKMSNPYMLVYFSTSSCDAMLRVNSGTAQSGTGQFYKEKSSPLLK